MRGERFVKAQVTASVEGSTRMGVAGKIGWAVLGALALLVALGATGASAAYAPGTPPSFCTGAGGVAGGECGELKTIAVDSSNGNVYVADNGNARIDQFTSAGTFVRAFGADVVESGQHNTGTGAEICEPANSTPTDICKKGASTGTGSFGSPIRGIAVDPTTHVVYVGAAGARVAYFNGTTGAFLSSTEGNAGETNAGAPEKFALLAGLAVDTTTTGGPYLYVAINTGTNPNFKSFIDKFTITASGIGAASYVCQISGTEVASKSATAATSTECGGNGVAAHKDGAYEGILIGNSAAGTAQRGGNLAVDASGNVYIAESPALTSLTPAGRHVVSKFSKEGNYVTQFLPSGGTPPLSATEPRPEALAINSAGNLLVADGSATGELGGTRVQEYAPNIAPATPPAIAVGTPLGEFGQGTIGNTLGVAAAGTDVYVADRLNKKVLKYSLQTGKKLKVTKNGTGTGTVTSTPAGINCGSECEKEFAENEVVELTGTPSANSLAVSWTGCDEVLAGKCKVTMSGDKNVTATFNLEKHALNVTKSGTGAGTVTSAPAGINCGATCTAEFDHGTVVELSQTPTAGSEFISWTGCDEVLAGKCKVTMTAVKNVTATFNLEPVGTKKLTVTKNGTGTGTVTSTPAGINCGSECEKSFPLNEVVELTGTPSANSLAVSWTGCDEVLAGKCKVTMSGDKNVTATFNLEKHALTVTKNGTGTGTVTSAPAGINCGATCSAEYDHGSSVTLTAAPGANNKPVIWTGCDSSTATTCTVAMGAAKDVTATFDLVKRTLTVTKNGTGTGTITSAPAGINCGATCTAEFDHGTSVLLTAAPGANTKPVAWTGCDSSTATTCTVAMSAAKAVGAKFDLVTHTLTVSKAGSGGGTVTCDGGACAASYAHGTKVTLAASADASSDFAGFSGSGCSASPCAVAIDADTTVTATFNPKAIPPPLPTCTVPKLKGKTLGQAKSALKAAHCALGKVTKPKPKKGQNGPLVVKSSSPAAGAVLAENAKVNLKLEHKKKRAKKSSADRRASR
jgi:hypothetical protein